MLRAEPRAERWGLHAFEDPDLDAVAARPVWTRSARSDVLVAEAAAGGAAGDLLDLGAFGDLATLVVGDGERILFSTGLVGLRLDLESGSLRLGPALLRYRLEGFESLGPPLGALRRLAALRRTGRLPAPDQSGAQRRKRMTLLLRAADAVAFGASQREIAQVLLSPAAGEPEWRLRSPSLRSRVQRLVSLARAMELEG